MSLSLGGSKQKSSQNTTETYAPNAGFVNRANRGLDQALGMMGGYQRTTQDQINGFANPYLDEVGQQTSLALGRSRDIAGNNIDAQAAKSVAFGNSGWALLRGENNRGYADAEAQALAGINAGGYDRALTAAMGENAAASGYDQTALANYLQGLNLLNYGTTTGNSRSKGSGMQFGANFAYGGK